MPGSQPVTRIFIDDSEVEERLAELDLTRDALEEAVRVGELERTSATELDPPSFGGLAGWALTTRTLREKLLRNGDWSFSNAGNLPLTINAEKKIAIAVLLGDPGTGDLDKAMAGISPTTKWPKGAELASQVQVNMKQLPMLFEDRPRLTPQPRSGEIVTWLLLIYPVFQPDALPGSSVVGSHVAYAELSVPAELDENGFVTRWLERIILNPVRLDGMPLSKAGPYDRDDSDLDIPVAAR